MHTRALPASRPASVLRHLARRRGPKRALPLWALGAALLLPACLGGVQLRPVASFAALDYRMPEKFVKVGGIRLCYSEQGRGDEAVVLLSPSLAPLSVWRDAAAELAKTRRVIAVDLPGAGKSDKPPHFPYTPDTFAQVLARLLDHLGLRSATLVGNFNGGATALAFALRYPERARRLVLLAPSGVAPSPEWLQRAARWGLQTRHLRGNPYTTRLAFHLGAFGQTGPRTDAFVSDQLALRGAGEEYEAYLRAQRKTVRNTMRYDAGPRLREVKAPTLILWGEKDRLLPRRLGERLRGAVAGSELVVLPGLGHMPGLEAPEAVARLVEGFLARTRPAAATAQAREGKGSGDGSGDGSGKDEDDGKESGE